LARRTLDEKILNLETQRDNIETQLEAHQGVVKLTAQGTQGASTDFADPLVLTQMLNQINNKLSVLYTQKDMSLG
jgi:hypothetical protein